MSAPVSLPSTPTTPLTPDIDIELEKLRVGSPHNPDSSLQITDDDELERFRTQWREELKAKKAGADGVNVGNVIWKKKEEEKGDEEGKSVPPVMSKGKMPMLSPKATRPLLPSAGYEDQETIAGPSAGEASAPIARGQTKARSQKRAVTEKERAVQIYAKAVEHEQSGQLNEALILYRKAFKMDDDVDRLYTRSIAKTSAVQPQQHPDASLVSETATLPLTPSSADIVSPSAPADEPYSFQRHIQTQPDYVKSAVPPTPASPTTPVAPLTADAPSLLTSLLQSLPVPPHELSFLPAEEDLPTPIAKLPAELIDPILLRLDVMSIEQFGATCWRARYLTHYSNVWRRVAMGIYKEPSMLPLGGSLGVRDLVTRHRGEWRTTLIEEERVRMDGCYISVCHYIRPGAGDEWVAITHMITYHRFLRFYPDGSVISFLTTEHPSEVVPRLRPSLRGKGLHFGRWRLLRSDQPINPETDPPFIPSKPGEKKYARILVTDLLEPGIGDPKYEFEMELALRETSRGRWNKLDILEYRSINLATGEALALSLKHQRPFYFSKVRSYNPPL
ncbi:hypothetical protein IAT38_002090 [Cryptococcus sp. DSM 104549]